MHKVMRFAGLTLMAAVLTVPVAFGSADTRQDRRDIRRDKAGLRHDARARARAVSNGNYVRANRLTKDMHHDARDLRHDRADLYHDRHF